MATASVLIDSSLFIEHLRLTDASVGKLTRLHDQRRSLITSSIVVAELYYGARNPTQRIRIEKLLSPLQVISFTTGMGARLAVEVPKLVRRNALIGFRDLAIACVALELGCAVATLNRREFERVEGLELVDLSTLV